MFAIETNGLCKSFKGIAAVQDLNLQVPEGAIYGFIGENGSGKSTTEKLICGLLVPTAGEITLHGKSVSDSAERANMGVLIESPACFPNSTVYQNLMMQALNLDVKNPREEVLRVLKLVSLQGSAERKYKSCSLGMKQRLGVAQSLLGHPKMLILDEPINGLDADGMRIVRETLLELNQQEGVTILISSHILGELAKVATHYGIIKGGTLIRQINAGQMSEECRSFVFVKTENNAVTIGVLMQKYREVEMKEDGIRIYDEEDSAVVSKYLFDHQIYVKEISYNHVGLEEYYLRIMSKNREGRLL